MKIIKKIISSSEDKTIKFLQQTEDENMIETGYYDLDEQIICISSQVGCPMGCVFCATGSPDDLERPRLNFIRNLTSEEIVSQVKNVLDSLNKDNLLKKRILFSFMGMGEPFLNYDNVLGSIKRLIKIYPDSRVTIATIGTEVKLIRKLARKPLKTILKIHLSLHAPNDKLRKKILPKAGKIQEALDALKYFSQERNVSCKVNYILIKDLNDSKENALELAKLLKHYPFIVKLSNLNNFNKLEGSGLDKFDLFEKILNSNNIKTCRFISIGTDIEAGCGQLRRHYHIV